MIKSLGGWPVATPGWDPDSNSVPSLEKLIAMLKRQFTLGVLLEEWIGPDDKHSENNVIQVGELLIITILLPVNISLLIFEMKEMGLFIFYANFR